MGVVQHSLSRKSLSNLHDSALHFPSRFGIINIHANGNYLSGSSPMFNSTTGRVHRLRVAWHSFASVYFIVYRRSTVSCFPRMGKNRRRLPVFATTPAPFVNARMPSEGLNEYRASTFGTRCCKIIDPFDLLCPP